MPLFSPSISVTRIYLGLPRLDATNANSALTSGGAMRGYALRHSQNDHIGAAVDFPSDWRTYSVKVQFVNLTAATSGDACLRLDTRTLSAGIDLNGALSTGAQAAYTASSTQYLLTEVTVAANVAVDPAAPNLVRLIRIGGDASDTLTSSICVIGLTLTKVS